MHGCSWTVSLFLSSTLVWSSCVTYPQLLSLGILHSSHATTYHRIPEHNSGGRV